MSSEPQTTLPFFLAESVGSERPAKPQARKPFFFARSRLWLVLIALLVLLPIGYVVYGMVGPPRYKYTVHQTKLIVDGEEVTVTGLLECAHIPFPHLSEGASYRIRGGTTAAAARLKGGGAILTMFPNACGTSGARISGYMYYPGFYPAIYLVDSATDPQRIDYYFSGVSLRDPNSRVQLVEFTTLRSSSPIRSYHLLARYRWGKLTSAVPGLMDDPAMYVGYTMTVLPLPELAPEARAVIESGQGAEEIARISVNARSPTAAVDLLGQLNGDLVGPNTAAGCQFEVDDGCRVLQHTFGLPVVNGVPTLRSLDELEPFVELVRRADLSGEDNGLRRLDSIEDTMQFELFGLSERVGRLDLHQTMFVTPDREAIFGLGVELLSRNRILDQ